MKDLKNLRRKNRKHPEIWTWVNTTKFVFVFVVSTKCSDNLEGIHKLRRQDFANFWPPSPLRRQVYYISLCSNIGIWLTPACLRT